MIPAVADRTPEIEALCRRYHVAQLGLFGSAATSAYSDGASDLDFLVEFGPPAFDDYANTYFGLLEALELLFGVPVDLVVRSAITNPYFLQSVEQTRTPLYEA
ncbi:MAG: nucleotidyltransferase domain-containing protein [Chloroflexi bacterium]|nr:nucleotidyltransferase domain-containing protein [Chloroflexota bacterium]